MSAPRAAFHQALKTAGIERTSHIAFGSTTCGTPSPVPRLLLWCEQNADVGVKLPLLAMYLGHVGLASSQRYLQLTKDLMSEITRRHTKPGSAT